MSDKDYLDDLVFRYGHRVFAKYGKNTPSNSVYIGRGRPGIFGNPIPLDDIHNVEERIVCAMKYRDYLFDRLKKDEVFKAEVMTLEGQSVSCWCSNGTSTLEDGARYCHGHILLAAVDWLLATQLKFNKV